jgi:hypothetical protein
MADAYELRIRQGATETVAFTFASLDLTGFSARMKGKKRHDSTTNVFSLTTGGGGLSLTAGSNSVVTATLAATTTAAMDAPATGVWDLECFNTTTGVVHRDVQGVFLVDREVTT